MAVRRDLRAGREADELLDLLDRLALCKHADVEVARARDVPLPRIARAAARPVVLALGADVQHGQRGILEPARKLVELDVHRSAATTSSSSRTRRPLGELCEPLVDVRRQLEAERIACTDDPRHVCDRREAVRRRIELLQTLDERVLVAAAEGVVVVAQVVVEPIDPQALERPLRRIAREERGLGVPLLEVLHDHRRLRQDERVFLEHRHLAGRILLVQPRGPVREVDLHRLVGEAFLREHDPHARAERAARGVVQRDHASSPRTSAICAYSSRAGGSSPGLAAVRATARTRAGSAPVRRETTVGFARSASASPGGSGPKYSGTERYSSTMRPRSWMTKRTTASSSSARSDRHPEPIRELRAELPQDVAVVRLQTHGCPGASAFNRARRAAHQPRQVIVHDPLDRLRVVALHVNRADALARLFACLEELVERRVQNLRALFESQALVESDRRCVLRIHVEHDVRAPVCGRRLGNASHQLARDSSPRAGESTHRSDT